MKFNFFKALSRLSLIFVICFSFNNLLPVQLVNAMSVPDDILDSVENEIQKNHIELPEVKAWEVDLSGNITEVTPLSERMTTMAPPKDGYVYYFDKYVVNKPKRNWKFKNAGIYRFSNKTNSTATVQYLQESTTTTNWNVTGSIEGSAKIKASFLGEIETKVSVSAGASKTYTKGKTYGATISVPKKTTVYITNYTVGINDSGRLRYKKYSASGTSLVGYYYENAGGTAISKNDVNVEVTKTEPN